MKFNMNEAWRDATAMMSGNREVLLIVAGIFFFLPSVVLGLAMGDVQELAMANPENAGEVLMSFYAGWGWLLALITIVTIVGYLALLALLRDHSRPTVGEAIRIGLAGLLPAIGAYLLLALGLGLMAGLLVAVAAAISAAAVAVALTIVVIGALYISVKVSLSGPVIAIDKVRNPVTALSRSWRITKGNSLRLFLFYLLLVIVYIVIALILGAVAGALSIAVGTGVGMTINAILSGFISAAVSVVFVAVIAAAHRQLAGPSPQAVSETFE